MPPIFCVDAFTDRPFAGNPAAVCLIDGAADAGWMQAVALEMNLSETAFVRPLGDEFELRWFTPTVEVDLCGHATLATAHTLWEQRVVAADQSIRFQTRSGLLTASLSGDRIDLDFPAARFKAAEAPRDLIEALGVAPVQLGKAGHDYFVEVADAKTVRDLRVDFARLLHVHARGVIVTSLADEPDYDFISRFFAPGAGINEDPVTGSAHCALGPYWQARIGRDELVGYQASQRGGTVRVRMTGDRVILGGQALTVWRGELTHAAARGVGGLS